MYPIFGANAQGPSCVLGQTRSITDLDLDKVLGSIEPRKFADLVLLDANPLDDIHNVEKVHAVVLNGRYLTRDDLEKMLPTFQ